MTTPSVHCIGFGFLGNPEKPALLHVGDRTLVLDKTTAQGRAGQVAETFDARVFGSFAVVHFTSSEPVRLEGPGFHQIVGATLPESCSQGGAE